MGDIAVLLGDHVHVGLQNHRGSVLMSGSGRLGHHHIAYFVGLYRYIVFFGKFQQIISDLLFMA